MIWVNNVGGKVKISLKIKKAKLSNKMKRLSKEKIKKETERAMRLGEL